MKIQINDNHPTNRTIVKLIPSVDIELLTSLSKEEVENILKENIGPKRGIELRFSKTKIKKPFEGYLANGQFEMQRAINYKNSFLPQITGSVSESINGTKVMAKFQMHGFVVAFMAVWLGGVSLALLGSIYGIVSQEANPTVAIIPVIMLAFGIALVYFGFNTEKEKSINELKRILKARIKKF